MVRLSSVYTSHYNVLAYKAKVCRCQCSHLFLSTATPASTTDDTMSHRIPVLQAVSVTRALAAAWQSRISSMRSFSSLLTCALIEEKIISIRFRKGEYASILQISQLPPILALQ